MSEVMEQTRIDVEKEMIIKASAEDVWESILEQVGPGFGPSGKPMPMQLEARPGGRWFRDLGNDSGHFWGFVQVIKPPTLLEICGPMFMSFPVASHLQYKVIPEGGGCRLTFKHKAFGDIPADIAAGVNDGWQTLLDVIAQRAAKR